MLTERLWISLGSVCAEYTDSAVFGDGIAVVCSPERLLDSVDVC